MVSYYNSAAMYRHQQAVAANPNGHFQANSPMHSWYTAAGYHQSGPMSGAHPGSYCGMQEDQQMWHPHSHPSVMFHNEFQDFVHTGGGVPMQPQHPHQQMDTVDNQLPSPPITVSGSEMSSPGAGSGNISPPNNINNQNTRPAPVRSPYEWIKKTSYQSQPNPEQESCVNSHPVLLDYSAQECHGKTRTKDKYRVVYTDHQRIELEKEFTFNNKYITIRRKSELAQNLGLSERQIKIWFQNRRAKERKQNKKRVEEKNQLDMTGMNSPYQQNIINQHTHHLHHHQHMDLNNHHQQHHEMLPTIVPSSSSVMSRFMKIENSAEETDPLGKTRTKDKYRVVYTDQQRVELEKEFYYSRYITIRRKTELATTLGLSERQVKIWFQNRRAKERKQVKKRGNVYLKDNPSSCNFQQQNLQNPHFLQNDSPLASEMNL